MERERTERLLTAWLKTAAVIRGNRYVSGLSYNEAVICGILLREEGGITASRLCGETNLLKSQINKLVTGLEAQGVITRTRSETDRRRINIVFTEAGRARYLREHREVMEIAGGIADLLGAEKTEQLSALLEEGTAAARLLRERREQEDSHE